MPPLRPHQQEWGLFQLQGAPRLTQQVFIISHTDSNMRLRKDFERLIFFAERGKFFISDSHTYSTCHSSCSPFIGLHRFASLDGANFHDGSALELDL